MGLNPCTLMPYAHVELAENYTTKGVECDGSIFKGATIYLMLDSQSKDSIKRVSYLFVFHYSSNPFFPKSALAP